MLLALEQFTRRFKGKMFLIVMVEKMAVIQQLGL